MTRPCSALLALLAVHDTCPAPAWWASPRIVPAPCLATAALAAGLALTAAACAMATAAALAARRRFPPAMWLHRASLAALAASAAALATDTPSPIIVVALAAAAASAVLAPEAWVAAIAMALPVVTGGWIWVVAPWLPGSPLQHVLARRRALAGSLAGTGAAVAVAGLWELVRARPASHLPHSSSQPALGRVNINEATPLLVRARDDNTTSASRRQSRLAGLCFSWVTPLIRAGASRQLGREDLLAPPQQLQPSADDQRALRAVLARGRGLVWALASVYGWRYFPLGGFKLGADVCGFCAPLLLNVIVGLIESGSGSSGQAWDCLPSARNQGYIAALLLVFTLGAAAGLNIHYTFAMNSLALSVQAQLTAMVSATVLTAPSAAVAQYSAGELNNFISTDASRVVNIGASFHAAWSLPFQIAVSLALLYSQVGEAAAAGLVFALLLIPLNKWIASKIGALSAAMMASKDARLAATKAVLAEIETVKLLGWAPYLARRVANARRTEMITLASRKYLDAWCVYFWAVTPVLVSILTFGTYTLVMGRTLTPTKVFTSLALFNMLLGPLNAFPWVLNGLVEAWVSAKRLARFLAPLPVSASLGESVVDTRGWTFGWSGVDGAFRVQVPALIGEAGVVGALAVVGRNESGKSTLLSGLTGQTPIAGGPGVGRLLAEVLGVSGERSLRIGLVSQTPFLVADTLLSNVTFGEPEVAGRLAEAAAAVCLDADLAEMPLGWQTRVGRGGCQISGGQRMRVALARIVYARHRLDLVVLDDPLAALDDGVAADLVASVFPLLAAAGVPVVVATPKLDARLPASLFGAVWRVDSGTVALVADDEVFHQSAATTQPTQSDTSDVGALRGSGSELVDADDASEDGEEEARAEGALALSTYTRYGRMMGLTNCVGLTCAMVAMQASRNVTDWWLAYWVGALRRGEAQSLSFYLGVYAGLAVVNSAATLARAFLFARGGIVAAKRMHAELLDGVLGAPLAFFGNHPVGRLLNRFSSDAWAVDDSLPFSLNIFLANGFGLAGALVIILIVVPLFGAALLPLMAAYAVVGRVYRASSRELKRLVVVARSPLYEHIDDVSAGAATLRAAGGPACAEFTGRLNKALEVWLAASYTELAAGQWLAVAVQSLGACVVAGVALIGVAMYVPGPDATSSPSSAAGLLGLVLSYALPISGLLNGLLNTGTETEKEFVSVERMLEYADVRPESIDDESEEVADGSVAVELTRAWYGGHERGARRPNAVLVDASFELAAGDRVLVVGRTGAGKSSLAKLLVGGLEVAPGSDVVVGGLRVQDGNVAALRAGVCLVGQDPGLFDGSVAFNVDASGRASAASVRAALDAVGLGDVAVDAHVGGRTLGRGARQRLCIARALVRKAKVVTQHRVMWRRLCGGRLASK
ncbi:multidrug resistance-associated protein [Thecamonas trahens ATCC 50062]|uniref:ABC-type xenobiotic transporter n=1 Tax=Thecamonas trahens ATCC 50062 TaxID=461836 RepID=A0A0L0DFZ4_THETB|nr:multidrug resistance-associated protein [Thecamonas trahens ATCC 50062]KNC50258.1 multidrug resistance-associated protein [Thecamonas trahens ATCC 50062]|eukprot:XP_013757087.1 multidrug resistance-associated protein [Thecamonas trahens ATCC 50062]